MNEKLKEKVKESLSSVLPITLIVLVLSVTLVPMEIGTLALFLTGAVLLIVGMGFFQLGAEMSMTPLGEGVGIQPTDSTVVAPVSGVLQTVAETGHAFGITTDDGVEVLVHVGIDTVKLNGEGFTVAVKANQRVNAGDTLATVDFDKVREAGYSTTTLMTVLNTAALAGVTPRTGVDVAAGDPVLDIQH